MFDVITVGSSTVDVFARTDFSELIKIQEPHHEIDLLAFPSGAKILINDLEFSVGGGGTNTAVAFARLGLKTAYLGKVGSDMAGESISRELKKEKIVFLGKRVPGKSGYSVILDTLEHDRTILTYKGVNDTLDFSEVPLGKLKTKWLYFSSMMGQSFQTLEQLAEFAHHHTMKVAFNPSTYLAQKSKAFLRSILSKTELLILNKEEACLICGDAEIRELLAELQQMGPRIIAITDGNKSLSILDGSTMYTCTPPPIKVVDATGAGDAFAATFLAGLLKNKSVEFSLALAVANAQSVLSHYGAKNILLTYPQAISAMKKLKMKINEHRK